MTSDLLRSLKLEWSTYFRQFPGLLAGKSVPAHEVHKIEPGDMAGWSDDDLTLVIEEGRRQLDRQAQNLEQVRSRAQFLLTTALALLALAFSSLPNIAEAGLPEFIVWSVGMIIIALGLLGATVVIVTEKRLGLVDTAKLSLQQSPVLPTLARSYAHVVKQGENTVATQITVYRDAVLLVLVGALAVGLTWVAAVA